MTLVHDQALLIELISKLSVHVVMPTNRDLDPHTVVSLFKTQEFLLKHGIRHGFTFQTDGSIVHVQRTLAAHHFLKADLDRMFWIDSDMVWEPNAFSRLLALSTVADCVFASYRQKTDSVKFPLYGKGWRTNEHGCLETVVGGLGFCCVRREVMEALARGAKKMNFPHVSNIFPEDESIAHIFRFREEGKGFRSEDITFFEDVRALGFSVWCDPHISLGHIGRKIYEGRLIDQMVKEDEPAFRQSAGG